MQRSLLRKDKASLIEAGQSGEAKGWRVPAGELEGVVLERLRTLFSSENEVSDAPWCFNFDAATYRAVLRRSTQMVASWDDIPTLEKRSLIRAVVAQVTVAKQEVMLRLNRRGIAEALDAQALRKETSEDETIDVTVAVSLRRAGKGVRLVIGGGVTQASTNSLVDLLRDAHAAREALVSGRDATIDTMTERINVRRGYVSSLLRLNYLSPKIVEAIISGRYPEGFTAAKLLAMSKDLPCEWQEQNKILGF